MGIIVALVLKPFECSTGSRCADSTTQAKHFKVGKTYWGLAGNKGIYYIGTIYELQIYYIGTTYEFYSLIPY